MLRLRTPDRALAAAGLLLALATANQIHTAVATHGAPVHRAVLVDLDVDGPGGIEDGRH
jgi:hypothetical protein